jgi:hypothetical protein
METGPHVLDPTDAANNTPKAQQEQVKQCVNNFYNSKLGKAVQLAGWPTLSNSPNRITTV